MGGRYSHTKNSRFLIDGYPRDMGNVTGWNEIIGSSVDVKQVLFVDCSKEITMTRLLERAKKDGRIDDTKDAIAKRFHNFDTVEYPIIEMFIKQGVVKKIDGSLTPEHTLEQAKAYF